MTGQKEEKKEKEKEKKEENEKKENFRGRDGIEGSRICPRGIKKTVI